jgi:dTDP-4-dehydrorhamnose reductase
LDLTATTRDRSFLNEFKKKYKNSHFFLLDAASIQLNAFPKENFDWIINCIGAIKPTIDEKNNESIEKAIKLNSVFPRLLAKNFKTTNIIQIATDCVFLETRGGHKENDMHAPSDIYGKTKSLGEVKRSNFFNIRCSIIGPEFNKKGSLFEWFMSNQEKSANGFTNHIWNGITTLHFAKLCEVTIANNLVDLPDTFHFIPSDKVTKYELLCILKEIYKKKIIVKPVKSKESLDRSLKTLHTRLNLSLWKQMGYSKPPGIRSMIQELSQYK